MIHKHHKYEHPVVHNLFPPSKAFWNNIFNKLNFCNIKIPALGFFKIIIFTAIIIVFFQKIFFYKICIFKNTFDLLHRTQKIELSESKGIVRSILRDVFFESVIWLHHCPLKTLFCPMSFIPLNMSVRCPLRQP